MTAHVAAATTPLLVKPTGPRLRLVDALRALAALMIVGHHFASYEPLADWAHPVAGGLIEWFKVYSLATQVFFVVGGYVMARSMSHREWDCKDVGRFVVARYCRLGFPYLAAIAFAIIACAFARGRLPENVIGAPPTLPQVLAHVVFLQDILGYESLSTGLWFVCISFQLALVYVVMLYLRDRLSRMLDRPVDDVWIDVPMIVGWPLSVASLFYFNLDHRWNMWAVYFFAYFFMGVMVHRGMQNSASQALFGLYVLMMMIAMGYVWRWRLATAVVAGVVLFCGNKSGLSTHWPKSRFIGYLGCTSYSLFLIHFPVLLVVATLWVQLNWDSPWEAVAGLLVAFIASLVVSAAFYQIVETPAERLSRRLT